MGPTGTLWDATAERYRNSHVNLFPKKSEFCSKDKAGSGQDIYLCSREKNHIFLIVPYDEIICFLLLLVIKIQRVPCVNLDMSLLYLKHILTPIQSITRPPTSPPTALPTPKYRAPIIP